MQSMWDITAPTTTALTVAGKFMEVSQAGSVCYVDLLVFVVIPDTSAHAPATRIVSAWTRHQVWIGPVDPRRRSLSTWWRTPALP